MPLTTCPNTTCTLQQNKTRNARRERGETVFNLLVEMGRRLRGTTTQNMTRYDQPEGEMFTQIRSGERYRTTDVNVL